MLCSSQIRSMPKSRSSDRRSVPARRVDDHSRATRETRHRESGPDNTTPVRLTRKYAAMIDGVDLTEAKVGDELNLSPRDADVLIAEGWAEPASRHTPRRRADDRQWESEDSSRARRTRRS